MIKACYKKSPRNNFLDSNRTIINLGLKKNPTKSFSWIMIWAINLGPKQKKSNNILFRFVLFSQDTKSKQQNAIKKDRPQNGSDRYTGRPQKWVK